MGVSEMKAEYKIPGGKLVACDMELRDGVISTIKLSGDFFMHPEDSIIDLERSLNGVSTLSYTKKILNFFQNRDIVLYGISPEDFVNVIGLALESR